MHLKTREIARITNYIAVYVGLKLEWPALIMIVLMQFFGAQLQADKYCIFVARNTERLQHHIQLRPNEQTFQGMRNITI